MMEWSGDEYCLPSDGDGLRPGHRDQDHGHQQVPD